MLESEVLYVVYTGITLQASLKKLYTPHVYIIWLRFLLLHVIIIIEITSSRLLPV